MSDLRWYVTVSRVLACSGFESAFRVCIWARTDAFTRSYRVLCLWVVVVVVVVCVCVCGGGDTLMLILLFLTCV